MLNYLFCIGRSIILDQRRGGTSKVTQKGKRYQQMQEFFKKISGGLLIILLVGTSWNINALPTVASTPLSIPMDTARLSVGSGHTAFLQEDGTVTAVGLDSQGQLNVDDWQDIVQVAANGFHTLGLTSAGRVVAVGNNTDGQLDVADWENIVQVDAGSYHSVGVTNTGEVVATGSNSHGQLDVENWEDVIQVSAGIQHTVGLKEDGTVVAVGYNSNGALHVDDWEDIVQISAGPWHTVGLKADGTVVYTGGIMDMSGVADWENIVQVAGGNSHTVGLKEDGTVVATGTNWEGEMNIEDWEDIIQVSTKGTITVGLKSDGTLIGVGRQIFGQLDFLPQEPRTLEVTSIADPETDVEVTWDAPETWGTGIASSRKYELEQQDGEDWTLVAEVAGDQTSWTGKLAETKRTTMRIRAITAAGESVYMEFDPFRVGAPAPPDISEYPKRTNQTAVDITGTAEPGIEVKVTYGEEEKSVTADEETGEFTLAGLELAPNQMNSLEAIAVSYGLNSAPVSLSILHTELEFPAYPARIAAGDGHTIYLKEDGTVASVGRNSENVLNLDDWEDMTQIAAGNLHIVGITNAGKVRAAGWNYHGEMNVTDWDHIEQVAAGEAHTVGLKTDGTVVAVGRNTAGQLHVEDWENIIQVSAYGDQTIGLKADGTVIATGNNPHGQLNVTDWEDVIQVETGALHTVGLKSDGTVVAVGINSQGQLNVEDWEDIVQVAAGALHTIGVKADGTVVATGHNFWGQLNVGDWEEIVQVAVGSYHTVGFTTAGKIVGTGNNSYRQLDFSPQAPIVLEVASVTNPETEVEVNWRWSPFSSVIWGIGEENSRTYRLEQWDGENWALVEEFDGGYTSWTGNLLETSQTKLRIQLATDIGLSAYTESNLFRIGAPQSPDIDDYPEMTNQSVIDIGGIAEPSSEVKVTYGEEEKSVTAEEETGKFTLEGLELTSNQENQLEVVTISYGVASEPIILSILHDDIAPAFPTIELAPNGWTNEESVLVTITDGEDQGSGAARTEYRVGEDGNWTHYEEVFPISDEGETTVYARTIDQAGNISEVAEAIVQIDRNIPTAPSISVDTMEWTNADQVIARITTEEADTTIEYQLGGTEGEWQIYEEEIVITEEGETTIYARTVKQAGSKSEVTEETIRIDRTNPEIHVIMTQGENEDVYEEGTWTNQTVHLSVIAVDQAVKEWVVSINGEIVEDKTDFAFDTSITETGTHQIEVRVSDQAGNQAETTQVVHIDQMAPSAPSIQLNPDGWTNAESVTATITAGEDRESGIARTEYRIGEGEWQIYDTALSITESGETKIYARTIDQAGNTSETSEAVVQIKRTIPAVPTLAVETNKWTNAESVSVAMTTSEDNDRIEYQLNGEGAWFTYVDGLAITKEGETTITARAVDQAGNTSEVVQDVVRIDRTAPELTLLGDNPLTIQHGEVFTEPGYQAEDNFTNDLQVTSTGEIDTNKIGAQELVYTVKDVAGNQTSKTRVVQVVDEGYPVITLKGDNPLILEVGTDYQEAGAIAEDNADGDISNQIQTIDNIDTSKLGIYQVTYQVTDSSANQTEVIRMVEVVDTVAPELTLQGEQEVTMELGDDYDEAGATASDNYDGDLSEQVTVTGSIDTSQVGVYQLTYVVRDSSGNITSMIRTINVIDTIAPTEVTIEANEVTANKIVFTFSAKDLAGIKEYRLFRYGEEIARIAGNATSYTDQTVQAGTTYHYELTAIDPSDNTSTANVEVTTKQVAIPEEPELSIERVPTLAKQQIAYGTPMSKLLLPEEVEVLLTNGDQVNLSVTWDKGTPVYDGKIAGSYFFTGEIILPDNVTNPNQHKALMEVIVEAGQEESKELAVTEVIVDKPPVLVAAGTTITVRDTETTIQLPDDLPEGTRLQVKSVKDLTFEGFQLAGELYDFIFIYPEGEEDYTGEFILTMGVTEDSDQTALYHYQDGTKTWEYIGGTRDKDSITATVNHFSIYGVWMEEDNSIPPSKEKPEQTETDHDKPSKIDKEEQDSITLDQTNNTETTKEVIDNEQELKQNLPNTATQQYNWLLAGLILLLLGSSIWWIGRKRKEL